MRLTFRSVRSTFILSACKHVNDAKLPIVYKGEQMGDLGILTTWDD